MKAYYTVEEIEKILLKNRETVLRYIRNGMIKEKSMIDAFLKYDIIALSDVKNDTAYLSMPELESISLEATIIKEEDTADIIKYKERLKKAYFSLLLENPNTKPYNITAESLLLLLQRRFGKSSSAAISILEQFDSAQGIKNNSAALQEELTLAPQNSITFNHKPQPVNNLATNLKVPTAAEPKTLPCKVCEAFTTVEDKRKFIKGLYLMEMIDGKISPEEVAMIANRASLLGITQADINLWVPDPLAMKSEQVIPEIKFSNPAQIAVFFLEAILLAWQDGEYSENERALLRFLAANNNISESILKKYEDTIFDELTASTIEDWLKTIK